MSTEKRDAPAEGSREAVARLIAAPIIVAVLVGLIWIQEATGHRLGTHLLIAAFGALAGAELALLFRAAGRPAAPREAALACALLGLVGLGAEVLGTGTWVVRNVVLSVLLVWVLVRHLLDTRPEAVDAIASRWVPILYVGFLFSFTVEFTDSARLLLWIVVMAKMSDVAGWAVGVPFGRHKMVPTVSPGKSWEGTFAGVAASVLVAVFLPDLLGLGDRVDMGLLARALLGVVVGSASVLAGVTWSGWKRRLGAKDSSRLIPAMGGIMDMVDSLLLAAPAAYLYFVAYATLRSGPP